jgi:hypothetical protein
MCISLFKAALDNLGEIPQGVTGIIGDDAVDRFHAVGQKKLDQMTTDGADIILNVPIALIGILYVRFEIPGDYRVETEGIQQLQRRIQGKTGDNRSG